MTGKKKLIEALESIGFVNAVTIFRQGTFPKNKTYPDEFVTFQVTTEDGNFYNDNPLFTTWNITVNYFSNSIRQLESRVAEIRNTLKTYGFIPQGKGEDAMSDEQSHTGWRMTFTFKDYDKE
jgi:hypothetical protein